MRFESRVYSNLRLLAKLQECIRCPQTCFVVTEEVVEYGDRWGGVRSPILKPWLEKVVGV